MKYNVIYEKLPFPKAEKKLNVIGLYMYIK